jgi:hypothetical protein
MPPIADVGKGDDQFRWSSLRAQAKQSIARRNRKLDCFVEEPVIGRAFARPVGSSQ